MTVHFIGAGPGAPDLLTLRGRDLIAACPVCLYAGSLVPKEILAHCPPDARIVNTAPMSLDEIIADIAAAHAEGKEVDSMEDDTRDDGYTCPMHPEVRGGPGDRCPKCGMNLEPVDETHTH